MIHAEALAKAKALVSEFAPLCQQIEIAGSLRRGKENVKDIEIVCQPMETPGLFGSVPNMPEFNAAVDKMAKENGWQILKRGPRYKQFDLGDIKADVFVVSAPAQWGAILAIRTGPAEFAQWLVTSAEKGGGMPIGMRMTEGHLEGPLGEFVETKTEQELFQAMRIEWVEPADRQPRWPPRYVETGA